jgi:hypothetical protein
MQVRRNGFESWSRQKWNRLHFSEHGHGVIVHTAGRTGTVRINMTGPGLERVAFRTESWFIQQSGVATIRLQELGVRMLCPHGGRTGSSCVAGSRQERNKVNPMGSWTGLTKTHVWDWVLRKERVYRQRTDSRQGMEQVSYARTECMLQAGYEQGAYEQGGLEQC